MLKVNFEEIKRESPSNHVSQPTALHTDISISSRQSAIHLRKGSRLSNDSSENFKDIDENTTNPWQPAEPTKKPNKINKIGILPFRNTNTLSHKNREEPFPNRKISSNSPKNVILSQAIHKRKESENRISNLKIQKLTEEIENFKDCIRIFVEKNKKLEVRR